MINSSWATPRTSGIPVQGKGMLGEVGSARVRLAAVPGEGQSQAISGQVGEDQVELRVSPDGILGQGPAGRIDLSRSLGPSQEARVTGTVGGHPVLLELRGWSRSEATITGRVGEQRVQVTQRRHLDGHLLTGYLGTQRFSLREREMPGQGLTLQPIDYLAMLVSSPTRP